MTQGKSSPQQPSMVKLDRLTRISIWACNLAIVLSVAAPVFMAAMILRQDPEFVQEVQEYLELPGLVLPLTIPQLWVTWLIGYSLEFIGLILLILARSLFVGFRRDGVFTSHSARRLRRIGWCVIALGPISILSQGIAGLVITYLQSGNGVHVSLSIEQADVYAVIIGLVIVSVGHIMLEAARLSEENSAFV